MDRARAANILLRSIEKVIIEIGRCQSPNIAFKNWKHKKNCMSSNRSNSTTDTNTFKRYIHFISDRSRATFTVIIHIIAKIYIMLLNNYYFTRRELYYQEIHVIQCQKIADDAVQVICCLLHSSPWQLGIVASSKGLVAGPLRIKLNSDNVIDCSTFGGTLIPHLISSAETELRSSAQYVLLIEKDAAFQNLLNENILEKLNGSLLVTGKGFPDVNTRILIKKLNEHLKLPIFALVDGDPYGIAIMCVYRFGSVNMSCYSSSLVTPNVKWLGIHAADLKIYDAVTLPLRENERNFLQFTIDKIFLHSNKKLLEQIKAFFRVQKKAEIEAICKFSSNHLTDVYIPSKLTTNQFY